jgi:mannose-6-phosphate isomerase
MMNDEPMQIKRPWGGYSILRKTSTFWVKKLFVNEGARLSLQSHEHRSEVWLVLSGKISAQVGNQTKVLKAGELISVPKNTKHRITGITEATVLEFAFGKVLERDILRYEDDFGRVSQ